MLSDGVSASSENFVTAARQESILSGPWPTSSVSTDGYACLQRQQVDSPHHGQNRAPVSEQRMLFLISMVGCPHQTKCGHGLE